MDGGEQLGRRLSFLDSGVTEEEEERAVWAGINTSPDFYLHNLTQTQKNSVVHP
jgi:hypothetical protein